MLTFCGRTPGQPPLKCPLGTDWESSLLTPTRYQWIIIASLLGMTKDLHSKPRHQNPISRRFEEPPLIHLRKEFFKGPPFSVRSVRPYLLSSCQGSGCGGTIGGMIQNVGWIKPIRRVRIFLPVPRIPGVFSTFHIIPQNHVSTLCHMI